MVFGNVFYDGKTEPRSLHIDLRAGFVSAVKALEYVRQVLFGNADARIFDG